MQDVPLYINDNGERGTSQSAIYRLIDYLHDTGRTATKLGCGEGGCGACTVLLKRFEKGKPEYFPINACLRPLSLCKGDWIYTVDYAQQSSEISVHQEIQQRDTVKQRIAKAAKLLAKCGGSQCGYCSPGMVASMVGGYSEVLGNQDEDNHTNNKKHDYTDIEDLLAGNLCRCTGYRSIKYAAKKLHGLPTGEDEIPDSVESEAETYTGGGKSHDNVTVFTENVAERSRNIPTSRVNLLEKPKEPIWLHPSKEEELVQQIEFCVKHSLIYKLVVGNTSAGIYKDIEWLQVQVFISLNSVQFSFEQSFPVETKIIECNPKTTINQLRALVSQFKTEKAKLLEEALLRVAGHQIRNAGSVFGSIVMAKKHSFLSDTFVALAILKAEVTVLVGKVETPKMPLQYFYEDFDESHYVLKSLKIDLNDDGKHIQFFKTAKRLQLSHSLVNAAFSKDKNNSVEAIVGNINKRSLFYNLRNCLDLFSLRQLVLTKLRVFLISYNQNQRSKVIHPRKERFWLLGFWKNF